MKVCGICAAISASGAWTWYTAVDCAYLIIKDVETVEFQLPAGDWIRVMECLKLAALKVQNKDPLPGPCGNSDSFFNA